MSDMPGCLYHQQPHMDGVPQFMPPPPMHHPYAGGPPLFYNQRSSEALPYGMPGMWDRSNLQITPQTLLPKPQPVYRAPGPSTHTTRQSFEPAVGPTIPRHPPRKPKRSGHALWVGNLPPTTTILQLKDFFSAGCPLIQSVFFIAKSNCAFVNYSTERACREAQMKFQSARFRGRVLDCRLRTETSSPKATPSPDLRRPSSSVGSGVNGVANGASSPVIVDSAISYKAASPPPTPAATTKVPEKYFVLKSLTIEDLEVAVRHGKWATQAHNEVALNRAYHDADNVYLLFSANKSREYFGYARMSSPIYQTLTSSPEPSAELSVLDSSIFIPTPATATAPKGQIVNDSARSTVFWEADGSDDERDVRTTKQHSDGRDEEWGVYKGFDVQWISTARVPFYKTRGLRNPWNANREVKVARDGTEIRPDVGRRLVALFREAAEWPARQELRLDGL